MDVIIKLPSHDGAGDRAVASRLDLVAMTHLQLVLLGGGRHVIITVNALLLLLFLFISFLMLTANARQSMTYSLVFILFFCTNIYNNNRCFYRSIFYTSVM